MRTNLVTLWMVGTLGGLASGLAQTKSSPPPPPATVARPETSGPRIEFGGTVFDFGKTNAGEVVRHDYVFTNTGTATLEIKDVRPGCGCTTAGSWDKTVEPGKSGAIPLQFNSTGFGGSVTKSATVICNDPGKSNVVLQITGTVWRPIDVTPMMAVFNVSSESQTNETKVVHIVSNLEEPVELSDLQCTNRSFQAELKTVRRHAGDQRERLRHGAATRDGGARANHAACGAVGGCDESRSCDPQQRDKLIGFVGRPCQFPGRRGSREGDTAGPSVQPDGKFPGGISNQA